jgi:diadenosine tetraphosphatase ApaH/serine/threonine PP2A family protein phosphatase
LAARVAVISDVHANLEALEEVLREVRGMELYCLGDFVDYGANPNEVVSVLRERGATSILGNHDSAVITGDVSLFNAKAAMSSKWTRRQVSPDTLGYLSVLPRELRVGFEGAPAYLVHGSPDDPLWEYVDPATHSLLFGHYLGKLGVRAVGMGHTHRPYVWEEEAGVAFNPGSVGQPRDGDNRASYATVEADGGRVKVEVHRVEYDYPKAASKIRAAGLPELFADRLSSGT